MSCCQPVTRAKPFQGSIAHIAMVGLGGACAQRAQIAVFDALDRLERLYDRDCADSLLMQIGAAPVGELIPVPDMVWRLCAQANDIAYRSDGLFDMVAAGTAGQAHWTDLDLSVRGAVRKRRPLALALGGLLKGFAADMGVQALREMGVPAGLVDVGGRVAAFGPSEWRVHFTAGDGRSVPVPVRDGAVALLGTGRQGGLMDPRRHVILSGAELPGDILVRAPSAVLADALTKVAVLRPGRAAGLLKPFDASPVLLSGQGMSAFQYAS